MGLRATPFVRDPAHFVRFGVSLIFITRARVLIKYSCGSPPQLTSTMLHGAERRALPIHKHCMGTE